MMQLPLPLHHHHPRPLSLLPTQVAALGSGPLGTRLSRHQTSPGVADPLCTRSLARLSKWRLQKVRLSTLACFSWRRPRLLRRESEVILFYGFRNTSSVQRAPMLSVVLSDHEGTLHSLFWMQGTKHRLFTGQSGSTTLCSDIWTNTTLHRAQSKLLVWSFTQLTRPEIKIKDFSTLQTTCLNLNLVLLCTHIYIFTHKYTQWPTDAHKGLRARYTITL